MPRIIEPSKTRLAAYKWPREASGKNCGGDRAIWLLINSAIAFYRSGGGLVHIFKKVSMFYVELIKDISTRFHEGYRDDIFLAICAFF